MKLQRIQSQCFTLAFSAITAVGGIGAVSVVHAAGGAKNAATQAQYDLEVQRCNTGQTNQDRAVCLQEAGAARDEAARKRLDDGQSANYGTNASDRCTSLPAAQRDDCLLQMRSPSTVKGSVESGGVLRETVIPAPAPAAPNPPSLTAPAVVPDMSPPSLIPQGSTASPLPVQQ